MAFTADDGGFWNLNKHVYPISEERLLQLMETAHKNLWAVLEIADTQEHTLNNLAKDISSQYGINVSDFHYDHGYLKAQTSNENITVYIEEVNL